MINLNHALLIDIKHKRKILTFFPFCFEGAENFPSAFIILLCSDFCN